MRTNIYFSKTHFGRGKKILKRQNLVLVVYIYIVHAHIGISGEAVFADVFVLVCSQNGRPCIFSRPMLGKSLEGIIDCCLAYIRNLRLYLYQPEGRGVRLRHLYMYMNPSGYIYTYIYPGISLATP